MSRRKRVALFTLGLATCLAASAAAAVNQARNLTLPAAVVVNGVRLNPGEYTLIWDVTRSRTSVSFANDTQRLATVPARLIPEKSSTRTTPSFAGGTLMERTFFKKFILRDLAGQSSSTPRRRDRPSACSRR